jgi:hypothetical protein
MDHEFTNRKWFLPFPYKREANLLRKYIKKMSTLPRITSAEIKFSSRKLSQFHMHPPLAPTLLFVNSSLFVTNLNQYFPALNTEVTHITNIMKIPNMVKSTDMLKQCIKKKIPHLSNVYFLQSTVHTTPASRPAGPQ